MILRTCAPEKLGFHETGLKLGFQVLSVLTKPIKASFYESLLTKSTLYLCPLQALNKPVMTAARLWA